MEVSPCVQDVSSHIASLLTRMNLQRESAQFCDCVVRQVHSPGQLYPAHRCVLAASSPVLASILSSTGALVELQAPCLSGSVLAPLLDYIYTGTLPYAGGQQQYYSLLTAARYLQMDELQEALRAWQQTEAIDADQTNASNGTENHAYKDIINTHSKTANSCIKYLPLTCIVDAFRRREEADTLQERESQQCPANAETCDEVQMHSASVESCTKGVETDTHGPSSINYANHCRRKEVNYSNDESTRCSISEHCTESTGNTGNSRQVSYPRPQDLIHNIPCTAWEHGVPKVYKEVQKDQLHSAGTVKSETCQKTTEEELVGTVEDRRSSSSSSSSSPHPCCGAVPVIRHSSRAAVLQLAEVSTEPPYHPVSQASVNSSRAPDSRSTSTDNDSIVEGIAIKHKNHHVVQNQDYRCNTDHTGAQSWDYHNSSDQCAIQDVCYKSSTDESDMLEEDYKGSSADYFMKQNHEHMDSGLSHVTDHNDHHAQRDSFQSKTHNHNFIRRSKYTTELSSDDLPSQQQRPECSDCHNVSVSSAAKELSQDQRAVVPLPVVDSEDLCPKGDNKEEHSYSSRHPAKRDGQDLCCNLYGPNTDWYPKEHKAETQDAASSRHELVSDNRDTAMENKSNCANVCPPISTRPEPSLDNGGLFAFERRTSLELEKNSDDEITEPHSTFTMPVDSNMSDAMYSVVGQSYSGHLHYHCLPQDDTQLLHRDSDHTLSNLSHPDYSDQSSGEEEARTFASPGHSSLRQQFATGRTDQVLLLDISAKPAELLVSCKHRSDEEEKEVALCKNDTFGTGVWCNVLEQKNEARSAAGFDEEKNREEERRYVGKDQSRSGADVIHKAGVVAEVSKPMGENQSSPRAVCSPPIVPDSVQASVSSTLSVCISSNLSASMPTNVSAHLSAPLHHPFQCSLCDRSFSQRGSLNRHVRSHLGVRPFPCPRCPMTFSRQYRVTEHMRVHQRCTLRNDFHKPSSI